MTDAEELWDWRRKIADLYHQIRSETDAPAAWSLWCAIRREMFRYHPMSPIELRDRAEFEGPTVFAYDPSLRLEIKLAPTPPDELTLSTGADGQTAMRAFARTEGLRDSLGGELTLYWIAGYGGGVFLPFADRTNGPETYGGGRYLLDTIKGADFGELRPDGRLTLDFNFSYFPSCAYSDRYVCPLAPADNRLPGVVRAGERLGVGRDEGR